VVIVTAYGQEISTGVRGPRYFSRYSDWLWAANYDMSMRSEIAQWV
jgi:hypothetical protein